VNSESLNDLLGRFHRKVAWISGLRLLATLMVIMLVAWSFWEPPFLEGTVTLAIIGGLLVIWVVLAIGSVHLTRTLQMARVLLSAGQQDNAEVWFRRVMISLSLTPQTQFIACQHLASIYFLRDAHEDVVTVCQELLRHRLGRLKHVWINTRLMLTDSLLVLNRVSEAYDAIRPIYEAPLTLADRMKLLPIQLRYELTANQAAASVQALPEKVRIAELLDSQQAALVHALLAEACRRRSMTAESNFLLRRARLYGDLEPLAQRYALLLPMVAPGVANPGS
jgi:hypothetical protein